MPDVIMVQQFQWENSFFEAYAIWNFVGGMEQEMVYIKEFKYLFILLE